jgi:formylmethanofuran--tetrahydromethanopterin N-formyltransferase
VGSKYKALPASTNDAYCPTLKGRVPTALTPDIGSALEIVIDGLTDAAVRAAMAAGLNALCDRGADLGVLRVGAGNYGGKLGKFHYRLAELIQ